MKSLSDVAAAALPGSVLQCPYCRGLFTAADRHDFVDCEAIASEQLEAYTKGEVNL
jgi:hypothetical protein